MSKWGWVYCLLGFMSYVLHANTTAQDFPSFKVYAKSLSQRPLNAMQQLKPDTVFEHYNDNPAATSDYKDVEVEKLDLGPKAQEALQYDGGGKTVVEHFGDHQFEINTDNPALQQSLLIEAESYAITHGISTDKVRCERLEKKQCIPTFHEEICHTSRSLPEQQCLKKRVVSVAGDVIQQDIQLVMMVRKNFSGLIHVNLVTGEMRNVLSGHLSSLVHFNHPCQSMSATVHSIYNNSETAKWVSVLGFPSCESNGLISFYLSRSWKRNYPLQIHLTVNATTTPFVSDEHWENECGSFETKVGGGMCYLKQELCTDRSNPHVITGLPVTRDCWEMTSTYTCKSAAVDECQAQKSRGCLQLNSQCLNKGVPCDEYEQTYQCPDTRCEPKVVCTQDVFCADGECVDKISTQSTDVGQHLASLAATDAVGHEYSTTQTTLFGGKIMQCKIWALDLIDCCSDKGWGKALHLINCRPEDKALGEAKLNYVAHYLGEYCALKELGVCVEHQRSYCVFNTKMARILQEEGRLKQLNPNALGSAEHPQCGGMSVSELQQLDMRQINFLNPIYPATPAQNGTPLKDAGIVGDVPTNVSNADKIQEEINRRVQQKVGG